MNELLLFYALLSVPVIMGVAYSIHLYRKHARSHKHGGKGITPA